MGRITETNYTQFSVLLYKATVYVVEEINNYILMDLGKRSSFSVNGT